MVALRDHCSSRCSCSQECTIVNVISCETRKWPRSVNCIRVAAAAAKEKYTDVKCERAETRNFGALARLPPLLHPNRRKQWSDRDRVLGHDPLARVLPLRVPHKVYAIAPAITLPQDLLNNGAKWAPVNPPPSPIGRFQSRDVFSSMQEKTAGGSLCIDQYLTQFGGHSLKPLPYITLPCLGRMLHPCVAPFAR